MHAAIAADLAGGRHSIDVPTSIAPNLLCMGPLDGAAQSQQQQYWPGMQPAGPQAWTVGADGYRVPLVPVVLPGGGVAYYPADSLPPGAMVMAATPDGLQAGAPESAVTLSGGIGQGFVEVQLPHLDHMMQQQQQYQQANEASTVYTAGVEGAISRTGIPSEQLRQEARLQDRAEAIFGQPLSSDAAATAAAQGAGAAAASGGVADRSPASSLAPLSVQQQGGDAAQSAEAAAAGFGAVDSSAGPGWMCGGVPGNSVGAAGGFSLWDGVVAAAGSQAPGKSGVLRLLDENLATVPLLVPERRRAKCRLCCPGRRTPGQQPGYLHLSQSRITSDCVVFCSVLSCLPAAGPR